MCDVSLFVWYTPVLVPALKAFGVNLQTLCFRAAHLVTSLSAQLDKLANHPENYQEKCEQRTEQPLND
ncbi:hypothetical protein AV530_018342 [Patagioenas fasciata monilis]|uniref:Uncharacterized protein n=1 Tax=Patagioenas fasciata monilis TaxID=372326 RepID=A0A1V4JRH6_PATFA|nr:hypothetical protein AV530_018342 [Patagioenas fasciata monilis]